MLFSLLVVLVVVVAVSAVALNARISSLQKTLDELTRVSTVSITNAAEASTSISREIASVKADASALLANFVELSRKMDGNQNEDGIVQSQNVSAASRVAALRTALWAREQAAAAFEMEK